MLYKYLTNYQGCICFICKRSVFTSLMSNLFSILCCFSPSSRFDFSASSISCRARTSLLAPPCMLCIALFSSSRDFIVASSSCVRKSRKFMTLYLMLFALLPALSARSYSRAQTPHLLSFYKKILPIQLCR